MFWNLWCERVKFLNPEDAGSLSETSVASSSSNSSLNLKSCNWNKDENGKQQVWCLFGGGDSKNDKAKWVDKHVYMAANDESSNPPKADINDPKPIVENNLVLTESKMLQINRFGDGVQEGCGAGLFLPTEEYILPRQFSNEESNESADNFIVDLNDSSDLTELSEDALKIWESSQGILNSRIRHPRRYGFVPQPHFLHGLGPWNVNQGDKFSLQMKRSASATRIRRQPLEPEMSLPISKRLLNVTISCEIFHLDRSLNIDKCVSKLPIPEDIYLLFWTPDYWYRPQGNYESYKQFFKHMRSIRKIEGKERGNDKIKLAVKTDVTKKKQRKEKATKWSKKLRQVFKGFTKNSDNKVINAHGRRKQTESYLHRLHKSLKPDFRLTAWDFDATTFSNQLTMIDRDLFLKINQHEFHVIMWQHSARNALNVTALIAFAHRISCLVATEILRQDTENIRARLIVRFINVADKCNQLGNFQSCRSVLNGLQCPAIYRLQNTWCYLRHHFANKYQLFENICRDYSDPRLLTYQKSFYLALQKPPCIPYIGDLLARLLNKIPSYTVENNVENKNLNQVQNAIGTSEKTNLLENPKEKIQQIFQKFYSNLKTKLQKTEQIIPIKREQINKPTEQSEEEEEEEDDDEQETKYNVLITTNEPDNKKRLEDLINFLNLCQNSASKYKFEKNDLAHEYLLKARYKEEQENFYKSLCNVERNNTFADVK